MSCIALLAFADVYSSESMSRLRWKGWFRVDGKNVEAVLDCAYSLSARGDGCMSMTGGI